MIQGVRSRRPFVLLGALASTAALVALVGATSAVAVTTFNVTKTADTNDGTCDLDCSLREAITAANTTIGGATVSVPAGTYTLTIDTANTQDDANAEGDLDITGDVTMTGAGPGETIIDGNGSILHDHVIQVLPPANAAISGVTVRNGHATAEDSGRDDGGGIHVEENASLDLSNALLTQSHADDFAGGLDVDGNASVNNVTISDNTAIGGAGGTEVEGTAGFTNVTVSGNRADQDGGGIGIFGGPVTLNNVTIAGNTADDNADDDGDGGGLFVDNSVTLANTIIAGNTDASGPTGSVAPDCGNNGTLTSMGHNLVQSTDGGCDFSATGDKRGVDPLLGSLSGDPLPTRALAAGSPAVDAGSTAGPGSGFPACAATDERGVARPQGAACDIGAYELQPSTPMPRPIAQTCLGRTATVVGTAASDKLKGTKGADVIVGLGGNDKISAAGGNDFICAGDGNDKASGGAGNDRINGEGGRDLLRGNAGNDKLRGGKGRDTLLGGPGRDKLGGGPGKDVQKQ